MRGDGAEIEGSRRILAQFMLEPIGDVGLVARRAGHVLSVSRGEGALAEFLSAGSIPEWR